MSCLPVLGSAKDEASDGNEKPEEYSHLYWIEQASGQAVEALGWGVKILAKKNIEKKENKSFWLRLFSFRGGQLCIQPSK